MRNGILAGLCLALVLSGCRDSSPSAASAPTSASQAGASPYAGNWSFTTWLVAVDNSCGHTGSDVDVHVGPIPVTVGSSGTFTVPSPVNATAVIDSRSGDVKVTLAARSESCVAGEGGGGCLNTNHCDGTAVQAGDVTKWVLQRR